MRGVVLLSGLLAAGLGSVAGAQDVDVTALQMKACALVRDDAARVRCYDRALSRPPSEPSLVTTSPSSGGAAMVPVPQAPAVVGPQAPAASPPATAWSVPQAPAAAPVTQAPPAALPQAPATANPQAPAVANIAPAVVAPPPKSEGTSLFDMGSIMRAVTPSGLTSAEPDARTWQVKADKPALQEATRLLATLGSPDEKAVLVLQCLNAQAEVHVTIPRFLGWDSMRVRYRINDGATTESRWAASADGRGAVAGNAVEFINSLTDGGTLALRLTDYENNDHDLRFSLGAVSGLRAQIATVCRWSTASVQEPQVYQPAPPSPRDARKKPATPATIGAPLQLH